MEKNGVAIMMTSGWNFFEKTGNIEAYLLYKEFKRILNNEYAEEISEEHVDSYEQETEGPYYPGDKRRGSGQDSDRANP